MAFRWVKTGDEVIYNESDDEFYIVDRLKVRVHDQIRLLAI